MEHEKTLQRKNSIVLEIFHPLVVYKGLVYSLSFCPFFCLECKKKPTQPFDKGWQWPSFSCSCLNVVKTHGMLLLLSFGFCSLLELRTTFWFSIYCWNQNTTFPFHCSGLQFPAAVSLFPQQDCRHSLDFCLSGLGVQPFTRGCGNARRPSHCSPHKQWLWSNDKINLLLETEHKQLGQDKQLSTLICLISDPELALTTTSRHMDGRPALQLTAPLVLG